MTNKTTLLAWVEARTEDECGQLLATFNVPPVNATHDEPDSDGRVGLIGVRADNPFGKMRWDLGEVGDALPPGHAKNSVKANLAYAQILQRLEGNGIIASLRYDDTLGGLDWRGAVVPGCVAAAPTDGRTGHDLFYTAAALIEHLNAQEPGTGGGNFGPPKA